MLTPEQLAAAHKANIDTLFGLARQALEGVEKLVELNLEATRAALRDAADHAQALLSAQDVQELLQRQAALIQPLAEKALAYSRQLVEIAARTSGAFAQAAEDQAREAQHKLQAVVDNLARNAPAGTEPAVQVLRNVVHAATAAMESVQQAVKLAADLAEKNFQAAADQAEQAASAAAAAASAPAARSLTPRRSA